MRTTVTLDSDVERILRDEIHRSRKSFKQILNDAVRSALKPKSRELPKLLPPVSMGIMPGIDPVRLTDLADELEAETYRSLSTAKQETPR
ncbi:MAG: antitoxin [bacterium]